MDSSAALGLPPPVFVEDLVDALEVGIDRAVLFLDLGSCCDTPDVLSLVQAWVAFHPGCEVVAFTPLLARERELKVVVALVREVRQAEVRVLTASDFFRDEVWRNLREMRERAALEAELRSDLLAVINAMGRPLLAAPVVLEILSETVHQGVVPAISGATEMSRSKSERARKATWKQLHGSGQLPASWLVAIFRVLWHAKLHSAGWRASAIARFLGFDSPRHFRVAVTRRLGVRLRDLKRLSYRDAIEWTADLLTPAPQHATLRTVRSFGRLLQERIARVGAGTAISPADVADLPAAAPRKTPSRSNTIPPKTESAPSR